MQPQSIRPPQPSLVRRAAKVYFAPFAALLWLMVGLFVLGLVIFALQLLVALLRYLHL